MCVLWKPCDISFVDQVPWARVETCTVFLICGEDQVLTSVHTGWCLPRLRPYTHGPMLFPLFDSHFINEDTMAPRGEMTARKGK